MLFFVKCELKGAVPLPPEQFLELVLKSWETVISYRQQGKILAGGNFAGRKGACQIYNVDSAEELDTLVSQLPVFPFLEYELIPLTTDEHALESTKQALAAMRASK